MRGLKSKKAVGNEGIHLEVYKFASERLLSIMSIFLSGCTLSGKQPSTIMHVVIIPLLKCKSKDPAEINNYRPIAIATDFSKVLEQVLLSDAIVRCLAKNLLERNVPLHIVKLFIFWYREQKFMVRWGNSLSMTFRCANWNRQGGQSSPLLYNAYTDDLNHHLQATGVGCYVGGAWVNSLSYADDMHGVTSTHGNCSLYTLGGMLRICWTS